MKKFMHVSVLLLFTFFAVFSEAWGESKPAKDGSVASRKTALTFATNFLFKPIVDAMIPLMEAKGYRIELRTFDDPISIDVATEEGSIDANFYQHLPYLDSFNRSRQGHLVMVEPHVVSIPIGLFSKKYPSVDRLPEGATIALAMDLTNKDRGLRMMRDNGLLTLAPTPAAGAYTPFDILDNPKKFRFIEVDLYQLLRSLEDVDAGVMPTTVLVVAGKDPKSALCYSMDDNQFRCGVVVREENRDSQWVKDILETITSDKCRKVIDEHYKGAFNIVF